MSPAACKAAGSKNGLQCDGEFQLTTRQTAKLSPSKSFFEAAIDLRVGLSRLVADWVLPETRALWSEK